MRDRDFHPLTLRAQQRRQVGSAIQGRGYGFGWCGLLLREGHSVIGITERGMDGKPCGSPWCSVCGRHAAYKAQLWMQHAIATATAQGLHVALVTLTQSHGLQDSAEAALGLHLQARGRWASRTSKKWLDSVGAVDALETTYGASGWHWHTHRLAFSRRPFTPETIDRLKAAWVKAVADCGGYATLESGCDIETFKGKPADAPEWLAAAYVAKADSLAWEVAGAAAKRGKKGSLTLVDLLALSDDSDARELAREGYAVVVGKRLRFSTGRLASALGIAPLSEHSDDHTHDRAEGDSAPPPVLATITLGDLRLMCAKYKRAELALVQLAKRYGQRGVDRAVGWTHAHKGNVCALPSVPDAALIVPRHERPIGTWTWSDWAAAANDETDTHHAIAQRYAAMGVTS